MSRGAARVLVPRSQRADMTDEADFDFASGAFSQSGDERGFS